MIPLNETWADYIISDQSVVGFLYSSIDWGGGGGKPLGRDEQILFWEMVSDDFQELNIWGWENFIKFYLITYLQIMKHNSID